VTFEEITPEFFQENQLDRTRPISKRGGPYNKKQRQTRQNEVFRLHFEHGYSARKISDMMKINRHTIDDDIKHGYSLLSKNWIQNDAESWYMKQINRMELQRTRLLEQLEEQSEIMHKLAVEKMILEIDSKIMNMIMKIDFTNEKMLDWSVDVLNNWAKENNLNASYIRSRNLTRTSRKTQGKIRVLLKEDIKNRTGRNHY